MNQPQTKQLRRVGYSLSQRLYFLIRITEDLKILPFLSRVWNTWRNRRYFALVSKLTPSAIRSIKPETGYPSPPVTWTSHRVIPTFSDTTVVAMGRKSQPPEVIVKFPHTPCAVEALRRQSIVLTALSADSRLEEWKPLLPVVIAEGEVSGQFYVIERAIRGCPSRSFLLDPKTRSVLLATAVAAISDLHRKTYANVQGDEVLLKRWVSDPMEIIQRWSANLPHSTSKKKALERIERELYTALSSRSLITSWIHGDYWPDNLLVTSDGKQVKGILDWDLSVPDGFPIQDTVQFLISTRMILQRQELGEVLHEILRGEMLTGDERELFDLSSFGLPFDAIGIRAIVLLFWLRYIASTITKSTRYHSHWIWINNNYEPVLKCA